MEAPSALWHTMKRPSETMRKGLCRSSLRLAELARADGHFRTRSK